MNILKKTLSLTLLISACGQSVAMDNAGFSGQGCGSAPFGGGVNSDDSGKSQEVKDYEADLAAVRGNLNHVPNPEERVAQSQEQERAETSESPETRELLAVNQDVQEALDHLGQDDEAPEAQVSAADVKPNARENQGPVAIQDQLPLAQDTDLESLVQEDNGAHENAQDDVAAQQEALDAELHRNDSQVADAFEQAREQQPVPGIQAQANLPQEKLNFLQKRERRVARVAVADLEEIGQMLQEPKPVAPDVNNAPAQDAKFYQPAFDLAKQVPGYYTANYLIKDGGRDMSKDNLLAHKRSIAFTMALYAATLSAIGGMVYGVTKFFKKPIAPKGAPATEELPVKSLVSSSARQGA